MMKSEIKRNYVKNKNHIYIHTYIKQIVTRIKTRLIYYIKLSLYRVS